MAYPVSRDASAALGGVEDQGCRPVSERGRPAFEQVGAAGAAHPGNVSGKAGEGQVCTVVTSGKKVHLRRKLRRRGQKGGSCRKGSALK